MDAEAATWSPLVVEHGALCKAHIQAFAAYHNEHERQQRDSAKAREKNDKGYFSEVASNGRETRLEGLKKRIEETGRRLHDYETSPQMALLKDARERLVGLWAMQLREKP